MGFEALREDEGAFFRNNEVATPVRVTSFNNVGGAKQPVIVKEYMQDTGVGKQNDQRDPVIAAYDGGSYNLS